MSESFQHGSRDERDSGESGGRPDDGGAGRDGDRFDSRPGRRSDAGQRGSFPDDRGRSPRGSGQGAEGLRGRRDDRGGPASDRGRRQGDGRDDRGPRREDRGRGYGQERSHDGRGLRRESESYRGRRDDRGGPASGRGRRQGDGRDDRGPRREDRGPRRDDRGLRREGESYRGRRDDRGGPASGRGRRQGDGRDDRFDTSTHRHRAPEIDEDITGRELDKPTRAQLGALEPRNAEAVAKHLVMAGRYLVDEPDLALEHALAAGRRGGRIAAVREATGVAAYEAGDYALALKELRTFRRMTGAEVHLPLMVDCERALGRMDKAVELATSGAVDTLEPGQKVELAIVLAGMRRDQGDAQGAVDALTIPQLDKNRGFSYSPRLFRAYAEALRGVGHGQEALTWERRAVVAEAALGIGQFAEPEIIDLDDEEETQQPSAPGADLTGPEQEGQAATDLEVPAGVVTDETAMDGNDLGDAPDDEAEDVLDEGTEEDPGEEQDGLDPDDDLQGGAEPDLDPDDAVGPADTRGTDADD